MTRFFPLAAAVLLFGACATETDVETQTAEPEPVAAVEAAPEPTAATPDEVDGVQTIGITVGKMGYEPGVIALQAGVPARLVFTRTVASACAEEIQVPAFGVETTPLPLNEPVAIEFTPDEAGEFAFVCGMDMMRGQLVVRS